jgi:hypothetical protein
LIIGQAAASMRRRPVVLDGLAIEHIRGASIVDIIALENTELVLAETA